MALPRIETSTRRIEIMPERRFAHGIWGEVGRELGQTGRTVGGALDRIGEVREREAERQRVLAERNQRALDADARRTAEYNERLAENFIANAAIGYETVDPQSGERKFVPGKLQKTRAEMKAEGTDSVKLTRGIIDEMRRESWYTSMDPAVRKHFDRQFVFTEDKWMRHAAENDVKARHAERVETMKNLIAERAKGVQSLYGMDDSAFVRGAATAAFRNMVDLEGSAIENPEIFYGMDITPENAKEAFAKIKWRGEPDAKELEKKYNRFLSGVVEFSINRVTALQKAAAQNQGLGTMDAEACLKKADDIVDALRETYFLGKNPATGEEMAVLSEDEANAIVAETERSRTHLGNIVAVETRKAREEKLREMVKSELSIRDIPQELWADAYETLGRDKVLRERAPEVAMRYLDMAQSLRDAQDAAKKKAEKGSAPDTKKEIEALRKQTEERLVSAFNVLNFMRLDGGLTQDEENLAQANIWRDFRLAVMKGEVSAEFIKKFQSNLQTDLSEQEKRAMRQFYSAFGYHGELSAGGDVTSGERKENADMLYYRPAGDVTHEDSAFNSVSGKNLFDYGTELLRVLRTLDPGVNREAIIAAEIERLKKVDIGHSYYWHRAEAVEEVMTSMRELKARNAELLLKMQEEAKKKAESSENAEK